MFEVNGTLVYSQATAKDMLRGLGMDNMDIENLATLLYEDEIEDLEYQRDVAVEEFNSMELRLDEIQSCMNEVLNMLDEALAMDRISKPRERLEAMKQLIVYEL